LSESRISGAACLEPITPTIPHILLPALAIASV
jgi:hypothetical protein